MDAGPPLDAALRRAAAGDRDAFRSLYDAAAPKLFGVAVRICGEGPMAEDALQAAMVEIWGKAGGFDPARGGAMGWMATIVRRRAIDQIRARGRAPLPASVAAGAAGDPGAGDADLIAATPDARAATDGGVDSIALAQCLETLDERGRDCVLLAYVEGLSREELSARYDAPVNTVKTWLRRGLASLKECLDG